MRNILIPVALLFLFFQTGWSSDKRENSNPVLPHLKAADPEILFSEKTKKFYLYPTTDTSGFRAYSSEDLVHWKEEGIVLSLDDISWENRLPWAPAIIEKKIDGQYRYFFYFCANLKIGVAVGDSPAGPFIDSGKPFIDFKPDGVSQGVEIDPDVFTDPASGKSYLYWGNSYLAMAELEEDFVTLKPGTVHKLEIPGFFEGAHIFYRNGIYYLMWSENDARSVRYQVRYATAKSPTGPFSIPRENSLILFQRPEENIYGTGHHSVLNIPGTDQWFIVYHRLTWPQTADPWLREVCIDEMKFHEDGSIQIVTPTHFGIYPVPLSETIKD